MTDMSTAAPRRGLRSTSKPGRWFYPLAGALMLALTVLGFKLFYFKGLSHPGREIPPPIRTLIVVHGVATSGWIVLFLVQPLLVALRKHRLHMALGRLGAGYAAVVCILGVMLGVRSAQATPPEVVIWGLSPKQFMAVPIVSILVFAVCVGAAVWRRKRPAEHRGLMLLATLSIMSAAVSRIDALSDLYVGTGLERLFGPFLMTLVIGAVLAGIACAVTRRLDRLLVGGVAALALVSVLTMAVARTPVWDAIASIVVD